MGIIKQDDVVASVSAALQYISYYHTPDFIQALYRAYQRETSPAARDAMAQILVNSRMCALGQRPICQDTGIVTIFVKIGSQVRLAGTGNLTAWINQGVAEAYNHVDNPLRASIVANPAGSRTNTKNNTPAVIHYDLVEGQEIEIHLAAKGGGSENKAKLAMLNPSDSIVDYVCQVVPQMGAGWCPPGILGIGIGGTAEKAMSLAKQSLFLPVDIDTLLRTGPSNDLEELRLCLYDKINQLGIGAQGLGGLTTVLDVKILDAPTHAASLPVGLIPNCAATRHAHFTLRGEGPVFLEPPSLAQWPEMEYDGDGGRVVDLDQITPAEIADWRAGETLLLCGKILTGRDAAHKKLVELIDRGASLPVDFTGRFIYYVGPVDAVGDEAVGPAGPTTATRMDKFTGVMLAHSGLLGMIGKAERSLATVELIKTHKSVYLIAVGGAAYLVSKAIKSSRLLAFPELGMEAIYEFEVENMPVTVAVDSTGESVHHNAPKQWQNKWQPVYLK